MAIDLKALTQSQLNELIQHAERRKEELVVESVQNVRERVLKLLADEGLSFDDVFGAKRRGVPRFTTGKVKAKYRNPDDATQTWAGRGKRPRWFNAALAAGKRAEDLLAG